jgi:hypothetical protein
VSPRRSHPMGGERVMRGRRSAGAWAVLSNLLAILSLTALKPRLNGSDHQQIDRMYGGTVSG